MDHKFVLEPCWWGMHVVVVDVIVVTFFHLLYIYIICIFACEGSTSAKGSRFKWGFEIDRAHINISPLWLPNFVTKRKTSKFKPKTGQSRPSHAYIGHASCSVVILNT